MIVTVPVSPTITVTDAACKVAPDESVPEGLVAGAPATVVVVDVVDGGETLEGFGELARFENGVAGLVVHGCETLPVRAVRLCCCAQCDGILEDDTCPGL